MPAAAKHSPVQAVKEDSGSSSTANDSKATEPSLAALTALINAQWGTVLDPDSVSAIQASPTLRERG